uniref:Uncharacterized protein n=1 Tax=Pseudomonas phage HRDY3 TaxID=3236930 RepID=A0AB39CEH8_9VIRU
MSWGLFAAKAGAVLIDGFSAAVLRKMPDGSTQEVVLETDNDLDYLRQVRDEYQMQDDDIAVYVKP